MDLSLTNDSVSEARSAYRNDIDGIRALAVILVILFHAGLSFFPSGFIGVDVFFTISGYLITGKVIGDIESKRFSFNKFMSGRLWRLQPALIIVMIVSCIVASYCYIPVDYNAFTKSAKYTSLFLSNQYFDKQSATYASPDADFFLLLHTWSLAIEWQWYLFFAIFASIITILSKRALITVTGKGLFFLWVVFTVVAISLLFFVNKLSHEQHYYSLVMRMFEFLIGGNVALLKGKLPSMGRFSSNIIAGTALFLILWLASQNISLDYYPNFTTLLVCFSTSLLFVTQNSVVNKTFQLSPVNYIGKISYSLYLWHWPVFAACNYLGYTLTGKTLLLAFAVIITLSVLCYHAVENRFRRCNMSFKGSVLLLVVAPIAATMTLYTLSDKFDGIPQRFNAEYNRSFYLLNHATENASLRFECHGGKQRLSDCHFGAKDGKKTAFLIGDSNANHFWGFYDVIGKDAGVKMYSLSTSTCLALPGIYQYDWWKHKGINYDECHDNVAKYYEYIQKNHYNFVIIGQVWPMYGQGAHLINKSGDKLSNDLTRERFESALRSAVRIIIKSGSQPVIMYTIAGMPKNYQTCINQHVIHRYPFDINECDNQNPHGIEDSWTLGVMNKMKAEFPTLMFVDSKSIQCITGKCVSNIDGVTVYRDEGHLTDYASYRFGEMYLQRIGNPFK